MKTYEDLLAVKDSEKEGFILDAIAEHKSTQLYQVADIAYDYFRKRNRTILEFVKTLYTLAGEEVADKFSSNYKFISGFFSIFVKQEVSHLLGNGVTFNEDMTKSMFGDDKLDIALVKLAKAALWGGVSFGFFNLDHVEVFDVLEFVPLIGEEDGALHAGIRFWQIDSTKPLRATLYEEDGYTEYIWRDGDGQILIPKRTYKQIVQSAPADNDVEILEGQNYPSFPIVPLWANSEHQSELVGLREQIDGYDIIKSGFANDLADFQEIYWTIQNAGGMDDIDLAKFIERMKTVRAAVVDDGSGSTAEAHTVDIPYAARQAALADIKDSLYRDAMALDTDKITAGSITATAIEASYENLTLKCDDFEYCLCEFIAGLLDLVEVEDAPSFKRSKIINMSEQTNVILSAAQYLDDETILKHLPFISPDEIDAILDRKAKEEYSRYEDEKGQGSEGNGQASGANGEAYSQVVSVPIQDGVD